jgi:carbon-monoxide dehydrogenase large subunit
MSERSPSDGGDRRPLSGHVEAKPRLVGARVKRVEDPRFLTGNGTFVDDIHLPGMLHLAFRRSDYSHARIVAIATEAARAMPGVAGVVTGADIAAAVAPLRATSRTKSYQPTSMYPLAVEKVRFVGEPVVAVLAEDRYRAEDAAEQVSIELEPLHLVVDPEQAVLPGATRLHDDASSNVIVEREFARGDVDAALAQAEHRLTGRFRFTRKTPAAMENRSYLADYHPGRRTLTLHSSTQIPGVVRDVLADLLDLSGNGLRVIAPDVGGGFGGKGSVYPEEVLVCVLARMFGKPVKWSSDRLEDFASTSHGFDEIIDAEIGLDARGNVVALKADVIGDVGAYSVYPWTAALEPVQVVSFMPGPYRIANYRGRVRAVATSKAPTGPYRGVGRPVSTFVTERLIDMAARRMGRDPVELRLQNFIRAEDFPFKTGSGIVWDSATFAETMALARDAIGYRELREQQRAARAQGRRIGIGFSSYAELTGIGSRISVAPGMPINTGTETATIRIDSTGAIVATFGVASHGQGLETTLAQVIADELGARLEDVRIVHGDTAAVMHGTGTYASRSAVLGGGAATLASRALREKIVKVASHLLEAATGDIDVYRGRISVAGTDHALTFRQFARAVYSEMGRLPKGAHEDLEATRQYDPYFGTTTSATHVAVVELDLATCTTTVTRYLVAEDCGRIINPLIVDGQVHGGVAQGIGAALLEKIVYDERGQLLTASFADYLLPAAPEIPPMQVKHLETESPTTLGGFRGMGEGGTIGAPAAIANAISDALSDLDIDANELPVTPERLFQLIRKRRGEG